MTITRISAGTLALFLLIFPGGIAAAVAGGPTLTLTSVATSYQTGQDVTVNVSMDAKAYEVTAAELHISFPTGAFQVISFEGGALMPAELGSVQTGTSGGNTTVELSVGSGTDPASGTGVAAVLVIRALQAGTHALSILGATQVAAVGEAGDVKDTLTGIALTVTGAQASPSPSPTPIPTTTAVPTATPLPTVQSTETPGSVTQTAGQVSTGGPGEVSVIALIIAAIATLLYTGYTSTDRYRHGEASRIAGDAGRNSRPFDFNA